MDLPGTQLDHLHNDVTASRVVRAFFTVGKKNITRIGHKLFLYFSRRQRSSEWLDIVLTATNEDSAHDM